MSATVNLWHHVQYPVFDIMGVMEVPLNGPQMLASALFIRLRREAGDRRITSKLGWEGITTPRAIKLMAFSFLLSHRP